MLQSSGYFSNINCPYFASGFCERPHCHFKHVRKDSASAVRNEVPPTVDSKADLLKIYSETLRRIQEAEKELLASSTSTQIEPATFTYIPTPKSTVQRRVSQESHIPAMCMPEYKPTPISQLRKMHVPFGDSADYAVQSSVSSYKRKINEMYPSYSPQPAKIKRVEEYDPTKVPRKCKFLTNQSSANVDNDVDDVDEDGDDDDRDNHVETMSTDSSDKLLSDTTVLRTDNSVDESEMLDASANQVTCDDKFDMVTQILQQSKSSAEFIKSWPTRDVSEPDKCMVLTSKTNDDEKTKKSDNKKQVEKTTSESQKRVKINGEQSVSSLTEISDMNVVIDSVSVSNKLGDSPLTLVERDKNHDVTSHGGQLVSKTDTTRMNKNSVTDLCESLLPKTAINENLGQSDNVFDDSKSEHLKTDQGESSVTVGDKPSVKPSGTSSSHKSSSKSSSSSSKPSTSHKTSSHKSSHKSSSSKKPHSSSGQSSSKTSSSSKSSKKSSSKSSSSSRGKSDKHSENKSSSRTSEKGDKKMSDKSSSVKSLSSCKTSSSSSCKSSSSKTSSSKKSSSSSKADTQKLSKSSSSKHSSSKSHKSHEKSKSSSSKSKSHKSSRDKDSSPKKLSKNESHEKDSNGEAWKSSLNGHHKTDVSDDITKALQPEDYKWIEDMEAELDNHDELEECWQIFNEDSPAITTPLVDMLGQKPKSLRLHEDHSSSQVKDDQPVGRRRVAHNPSSIAITEQSFHKAPPGRRSLVSPSQAMTNRFQKIQDAYARQSEQLYNRPTSTAFDGLLSKQRGEHRVAHVPNAALLAAMSPPRRNSFSQPSGNAKFSTAGGNITVASTVGKGERRIAHTPIIAQSKRPIIPVSYGNKVALNVRQRYLNLFIDECLKFATSEEAAYAKGLEEEAAAYERSSNKTVYLNVVVNTLKRLRTEAEAGPPPAPLSPPPESLPVFVDSPPQQQQQQQQLAQRRPTSHQAMLGGAKAAKTSYSIHKSRPKSQTDEKFRGSLLYKLLQKYVMPQEELVENGYPQVNPDAPGKAIIKATDTKKTYSTNCMSSNSLHRQCSRCKMFYAVNEHGIYMRPEECVYHWGHIWKKRIAGSIESRYSCCQGDAESEGCIVGEGHVVDNFDLEKVTGFVQTLEKPAIDGNYGVYALDCEMCYTTQGMELTRITVIADSMKPIYETMVKPENPVLDHNTRFSGITKEDLEDVHTSLRDVQAVLLSLFSHKTILIGHSLESDFKALRLIHSTVVDTSIVFPHRRGPPFKRALRTLMAECLNKIIQNNDGGHDSQEDAVACLELMMWKIKEDLKCSR